MEIQEFRKELDRIKNKYEGINLVLDDGHDEGNADQNISFWYSIRKLERIRQELAYLELNGVDVDIWWNEACKDVDNVTLPEGIHKQIGCVIEFYVKATKEIE